MRSDRDNILKFMIDKLGDEKTVMKEYHAHRIKELAKADFTLDQLLEVASDEEWGDELHEMKLADIVRAILQKDEEPVRKKAVKKKARKKTSRLPKRDPEKAEEHKRYRKDILAFLEKQKRPVYANTIINGVTGRPVGIKVILSYLVKEGWVDKKPAPRGGSSLYSKAVNSGFKLENPEKDVPIVNQVMAKVKKLFIDTDNRPVTMGEIHKACNRLPLSKKQISRAVRAFVSDGMLRRQKRGVYALAGHTHRIR